MRFSHDPQLLAEFPQLSVATLGLDGVTEAADVTQAVEPFLARAANRLATGPEGGFPEIAAWRRTFAQLGLKPTQYRCASEALLRRLRKEGSLPAIHPLVDLCNAVSVAYAIPIAVIDLDQVSGDLTVTRALGTESYLSFGGEVEQPDPGEVIFVDSAGHAHARRWTNRQSAQSAIRPETRRVLIVAEAMHDTGSADIDSLRREIAAALDQHWGPRSILRRALDQIVAQVRSVQPEQLADPTPCGEYDVRALIGHTVGVMIKITKAAEHEDLDDVPDVVELDDAHRLKAVSEARLALERAWSADDLLAEPITLPWGTMTGTEVLEAYTHEFTVHAWDLATAIGTVAELDPDLAVRALAWFVANEPADDRDDHSPFGAPVDVDAAADPYTRLAAFTGRALSTAPSTP